LKTGGVIVKPNVTLDQKNIFVVDSFKEVEPLLEKLWYETHCYFEVAFIHHLDQWIIATKPKK
jgi:hypothetical protein